MIKWRFPSNDYGESKGINDSGVATFRGTPLKSLAREICQNSLDAAVKEKTIVEFNMFMLPSEQMPGKDELEDSFHKCKEYWKTQNTNSTKEFFEEAIKCIQSQEIPFLRISDFNTTGLKGSKGEINTDWTNLTKSSGSSDKRGTAGGSYGIGKYAPFACSCFSTVFYSTYDIDEVRASQGVSRIVTFKRDDGQDTQGIGYFGEEKNTPIFEEMKLDSSFSRNDGDHGTDIYIAGYKYGSDDWKKDIIVSVLDGFLGAIWNEKLEIKIGELVLNKSTLKETIETYKDNLTGYVEEYYKVLTSEDTVWKTTDLMNLGEIRLGLSIGDAETPKRIAMIRKTGMKIMDKDHLPGTVPIIGVMFINGEKINSELRLMENPEHTKWEPQRAKNPNYGSRLIKEINDFIKDCIFELIDYSSAESVDAAGVGNYIPDIDDGDDDKSKVEVVSERILDIELKQVKKSANNSSSQSNENDYESEILDDEISGSVGGDGDQIHQSSKHLGEQKDDPIVEKGAKPDDDGEIKTSKYISIGAQKIAFICVDKNNGKYMLRFTPESSVENGVVEIFLSAETDRYPAPLKRASAIGEGELKIKDNKIVGLPFKQGEEIKLSLEIDYYDYCSMEVVTYAIER